MADHYGKRSKSKRATLGEFALALVLILSPVWVSVIAQAMGY